MHVERMSMSLASVADDGYSLPLNKFQVGISVIINVCHYYLLLFLAGRLSEARHASVVSGLDWCRFLSRATTRIALHICGSARHRHATSTSDFTDTITLQQIYELLYFFPTSGHFQGDRFLSYIGNMCSKNMA